jgi:N-acetylglucosamine transport system permease protein
VTRSDAAQTLASGILRKKSRPRSGHAPVRARRGFSWLIALGTPIVWGWCIFNVLLFVWVILQSFRNGATIFTRPLDLPTDWSLRNYVNALEVGQLASALVNSVIVATSATLVVVVLASMAAYVLSRSKRRSARPIAGLFILGMGIPVQAMLIPVFVLMQYVSRFMNSTIGYWDDRLSLFIVYVAINLPFAVFVLSAFFRNLPTEIEEAAALDGASPFKTFTHIMFPLARPGVTTILILTLLAIWNETLLSLVFITSNSQYLLPQAILGLYGTMQYTSNWGGLFAGLVVITVPVLIAYIFLGQRIVSGMTLGAGK